MKPLRLRMKAFGSYLHETKIDFTQFGEHPLFLITGATGGGKTTILDAMCFALYCSSTGELRKWKEMRSLSAKLEDETLVEFEFAYHGAEYKWFRSLQEYYSKRTDAVRERETHECYRKKPQGEWELLCSGSAQQVTRQAEQLLGLTCKQFSQVVVLPQGDFLKLLLATSTEKAALLQTLFATERWERLMKRVRGYASDLTEKAGQNDAERNSVLTREAVQDLPELEQKCTHLTEEAAALKTSLAAAQTTLGRCNGIYDSTVRVADAYDRMQQTKKALTAAAERAKAAGAENAKAQAELPHAEECRAHAKELGEQAATRQSALNAARELDALHRQIVSDQKELQQSQAQLQQAQQTQQAAREHWQTGTRCLLTLNHDIAALNAAITQETKSHAAALVAAELTDGCPCPVCGSVQHPNPAQPSARGQQLQAELNEDSRKLKRYNSRLKELEGGRKKAEQEAEICRSRITELTGRLSANLAKEQTISAQMQGSATLAELEQTVRRLRQEAVQQMKQETTLRSAAENAHSREAAAAEAYSKAEEDCKKAEAAYHLTLTEYRAQPNVPQDTERPDEKAAQQQRDTAQQQAGALAEQAGHARASLQSAQKSLTQLRDAEQAGEVLHTQYEEAHRLSDLLSGKTQQKVPIQQFVLGVMLDDILARGNVFFSELSGGRYRLLRSKTPAGGNALGGLDLEVLDAASGKERNVGTLSGGELFLASLSLAFGLSDTVQSYSGAVRLDSLFIDEGFGSLDQETLDTAMSALLRLQKSGRTVGIISHVTELQSVIQQQLVVTRLPDGTSSVKLVTS